MHRILQRTLAYLSSHQSDELSPEVQSLLEDSDLQEDEVLDGDTKLEGNDDKTWQSILMDLIDAKSMSHAEVNRKRKLLSFAAFRDARMVPRVIALESLVSANVHLMHTLFQRSQAIATCNMSAIAQFSGSRTYGADETASCH